MANRMILNETAWFGRGAVGSLTDEVKRRGYQKALIVTDKTLVQCGVVAKVTDKMDAAGLAWAIYDGVVPNPTITVVKEGLDVFQNSGADYLIAIGGGSSMDTAKAIGIIINNPEFADVRSLEGVADTKNPAVPIIAVPTTAGTAAEVTINYVITDAEKNRKMVCVDPHDIPVVAVVDPDMMSSMPKGLTAATGMDALTHAVEAYVSTAANPITDACAEKAITMISQWLRPAVANGENIEARDAMSYAQYLAGMAFNNASLGYVHAMAHQLGGFYNLPHGVCNAVLLPHVCEFNLIACQDRYAKIAELMGVNTDGFTETEAAFAAIDAIRELSSSIGIPSGLNELGVKTEDLAIMAENAQKDACMLTNPRKATHAQVVEIFKAAL